MKTCTRCLVEKHVAEFSKRSDSDRLNSWCKKCRAESSKKYAPPPKHSADWYAERKEGAAARKAAYAAQYRKAHEDELRCKARDYYYLNKEKCAERVKRYFDANKERLLAARKVWVEKFGREAAVRWRLNNPERLAASKKKRKQRERKQLKDQYIKKLLVKGTRLSQSDIPASLIDAKREQLKIMNLLKEFEHERR